MQTEFTYLESFINHIDVQCPQCEAKALVTSDPTDRSKTKFTCLKCGHSKSWKGNAILLGQPVDCFFKIPLWYTKTIKNELLFAYNLDHLEFLASYIDDPLRTRKQGEHGWSNQSLESRLPKWLLSAKNRDTIVKAIAELKVK